MLNQSLKSQRKKILVTLGTLSILSIIILLYKTSRPVLFASGIVQNLFSIPKSILYSLGKKESNEKISSLTKENYALKQKFAEYQIIRSDNDALKSQFNISTNTSQNLIATKIIGFQGDSRLPSELIINAGIRDGVKKGMTVIFQKYLIGKIESLSQNYSVVITPINPHFKVLAKLPETNANGILIGKSDFMIFDGVVITDTLKKDGIVVTKGEVDQKGIGIFPDIILGKISSISKNETSPFQSAEVVPIIDYSKLIDVFIIAQM